MGIYGMYPMADMLNHEFGSTDVSITEGKGGELCFQILSGRDVQEGEQVTVMPKPFFLKILHPRNIQSEAKDHLFKPSAQTLNQG